jgi:hypothetical protein
VTHANNFLIFGGKTFENIHNDLFLYSIHPDSQFNGVWRTIKTKNLPAPRFGHTAVINNEIMYVFGGKREDACSNELCIYDIKTKTWTTVTLPIEPRYHHTMCLHENTIYIIGGRDDSSIFDDIFSVNCDNFLVTELTPLPDARYGHVSYFDQTIHVFGGCNNAQDFSVGGIKLVDNCWETVDESSLLYGCVHAAVLYDGKNYRFYGGTTVHQKIDLGELVENDVLTIVLDYLPIRDLSKIICTSKNWKIAQLARVTLQCIDLQCRTSYMGERMQRSIPTLQ